MSPDLALLAALTAALSTADAAPAPRPSGPPPGFTDLAALPGLQFQIGYATALNFTGAPLPGYASPGAWLRKEAAASLGRILQKILPEGYGLVIYDAYRPARASAAMVTWARATGHADWVEDGYIAEHSVHNTGAAVDLSLTRSGQPVDMGGGWDEFGPSAWTNNASGAALENRKRLKSWMEAEGWVAYSKEWWHFSYPMPDLPRLDTPYPDPAPEAAHAD